MIRENKEHKNLIEALKIPKDKKATFRYTNYLWLFIIVCILLIVVSVAMYPQDRYNDTKSKSVSSKTVNKEQTPDEKMSLADVSDKSVKTVSAADEKTSVKEGGKGVLTVVGYIIPRERIEISPRFMAEVEWIGVKKGDKVKKGDILVRLDSREQKAAIKQGEAELNLSKNILEQLINGTRKEEIEQAESNLSLREAELKNAQSLLERRKTLLEKKSISQEEYDNALRNRDIAKAAADVAQKTLVLAKAGPRSEEIEQAKARVKAAEASLERTKIYYDWTQISSPVDGVVLEKLATVGEMVVPQSFGNTRGPSTALLSIADLNDLQVECELSESDISKIYMGQICEISPEAFTEKKYRGHVAEIAPEANRQKGTLQVKVQIEKPDEFLTPELSAKVIFLSK